MTLTREEIERLRRLAEKATPGPWKYTENYLGHRVFGSESAWEVGYGEYPHGKGLLLSPCKETAEFIAAANPETLRELLRGYEAWLDGIKKIKKEIAKDSVTYEEALHFALDALKDGKE